MLQLLLLSRFCYSASAVDIIQILLQCFSCCYYLDYVTMTLLGHNLYSVTVLQLWPYSKCCYSVSAIVIFQWCYSASAVVIFHCFYSVFILFRFRRQLLRARGTFFTLLCFRRQLLRARGPLFIVIFFRRQLLRARGTFFYIVMFQASAVASTWARRCNKIIFVTSETVTDEGYTVQYIKVYWKCCNVSYFLQQMQLQLRLGCQRNKLLPFWRNKKFDKIHIQVGLFSFHFQTINSFYS